MPAYNFQTQFAELVKSGKKRQTIRPQRIRPTKPGDKLVMYSGMRTKNCQKLGEFQCRKIDRVLIDTVGEVKINNRSLDVHEMVMFSANDGFSSLQEFFDFFRNHYGARGEFVLIRW